MKWNNSIFLIDAKFLCYRSVYALFNEPISSVENSMMYGFMNTLLSLAKGLKVTQKKVIKPSNVILCWDSKHSYRQMKYPDYKKKVKLTDQQEEVMAKIREAYPKLMYWCRRMGFTSALMPGYEADDLFAGYVRQYNHKHYVIVTNDEDIYQLLDEHVAIWLLRKKPFLFTEEDFIEKYNVHPTSWAEVKAVGGCKSDNIPGLQGIGEKRALQWVRAEASEKIRKSISNRWTEIHNWLKYTRLPYNGVQFKNLSLDPTDIDWDEFTKWCQIYNFKRFIIEYTKFREAFDFGN
jgi:DNA polymerase-1